MIGRALGAFSSPLLLAGLLVTLGAWGPGPGPGAIGPPSPSSHELVPSGNGSVVGNFSAALGRIVTLLGAAGGAILAIAWSRVALSWFSNEVSKKMQAKERARDALVGTVIFAAALSGIVWGLAQWILGAP
ncbi:MAG: hypothetical protein L3J95_04395 [Thermoplasmata archaeon]|nr:hypothetical protein [Thermoplasmata archaeon]MCI4359645.1 hypothetical protein [Thermoplasmata archaeon]